MKGLLLLYGECFREGLNGTRLRDTPTSYLPQKEASLSHIDFCDEMKKKGVIMEILIHTYHSKYKKDLLSWYSYPTRYVEKKNMFKTVKETLDSFMKIATKIDHSYDFILLTRMDIFLKPPLYKLINPHWNKVYFFSQSAVESFNCGFLEHKKDNTPAVNPMIQFVPKRYFYMLPKLNIDHDAWETYEGIEKDFMVNEYYDADTYKDLNPYFKIANRPESNKHYGKGKKINRTLFNSKRKIKCKVTRKF